MLKMDIAELLCNFQKVARREIFEDLKMQVENDCAGVFNIPDDFFRNCFHFNKQFTLDFLVDLRMRSYYNAKYDSHPVPFDIRVLATLSFLMHGHLEYLKSLAPFRGYAGNTLLRCVPEVCKTIVYFVTPSLISFPHDIATICRNKRSFAQQFGVPGVIGVMDSFFVGISRVTEEFKKWYTNRRGVIALKVQVICDEKFLFLDVNARYGGSVSDTYVWKRSHIRHIMRHLYEKDKMTWLVADRGYYLEEYVMNPYRNACTPQQKSVNVSLKAVLGTLHKGIALLKARFRCLNVALPFDHQECANIITSCATLHNYIIFRGCAIDENLAYQIPKQVNLVNANHEDSIVEGRFNRELIRQFIFNNNQKEITIYN